MEFSELVETCIGYLMTSTNEVRVFSTTIAPTIANVHFDSTRQTPDDSALKGRLDHDVSHAMP